MGAQQSVEPNTSCSFRIPLAIHRYLSSLSLSSITIWYHSGILDPDLSAANGNLRSGMHVNSVEISGPCSIQVADCIF